MCYAIRVNSRERGPKPLSASSLQETLDRPVPEVLYDTWDGWEGEKYEVMRGRNYYQLEGSCLAATAFQVLLRAGVALRTSMPSGQDRR